jgi:hypothetical protein
MPPGPLVLFFIATVRHLIGLCTEIVRPEKDRAAPIQLGSSLGVQARCGRSPRLHCSRHNGSAVTLFRRRYQF